MALSIRNYIENCYTGSFIYGRSRQPLVFDYSFNYSSALDAKQSTDSTKAFSKYMKIDLNGDIIEVPCVYKYIVRGALIHDNNKPDSPINTLYVPMYYLEEDNTTGTTSNALLRKFFYNSRYYSNLVKKRSSNLAYLGGEGILLYEDYTPLMLFTFRLQRHKDSTFPGKFVYSPLTPILRINPILYSKDDILAKYIKSKLIPAVFGFGSNGLYNHLSVRNSNNIYIDTILANPFRVIIEDFSNFFVSPSVPDTTFNSADINKTLYEDYQNGTLII